MPRLRALVRDRSDAQVVAVVGSTGKTTTKDALGALCAAVTPTVAAEASRNNELGLPLTVLRLEPETRVLVTEMGMRGLGQMAELCAIARPTVALVTSIGPEHLELVGTVEDVARANAEALEALPSGGIAVVPSDEPRLEPFLRRELDVRRFDRRAMIERGRFWRFDVAGRAADARPAVHPATSRRERARGPNGVRRARTSAGPGAGGRGSDHPQPVAGRGARAARGRLRGQRRLQREPCLDARRDRRPRRAGRRAVGASPSSARWRSSAPRATATTARSRRFSQSSEIEVVVAVGEERVRVPAVVREGHFVADVDAFRGRPRIFSGRVTRSSSRRSRAVGLEGIPALIEKHSRAW